MFRLAAEPIDPAALAAKLADVRAGACVTFEGWVRNRNEGRPVEALDYEAYAPLTEKEGARILAEAQARFEVLDVVCVHRVGRLALGDLAVWVGVIAEHRGAAFDACRYVIDEAKARLPIWKKEHYTDGATAWINCAIRGDHAESSNPSGGPAA
jgi:molybdopterin synthase catalytic subunit